MKGRKSKYKEEVEKARLESKKFCIHCTTTKELSEFGKDNRSKDKLTFYCSSCCAKKNKENMDKIRVIKEIHNEWKLKHNKYQRNYQFKLRFGNNRYKQ